MSPTHACPLRMRYRYSDVHAGVSSLRLWNGSTNTAPLNCARRHAGGARARVSRRARRPRARCRRDRRRRRSRRAATPPPRSRPRRGRRRGSIPAPTRTGTAPTSSVDRDRPGDRGNRPHRAGRGQRHEGFPSTAGLTVFSRGQRPRWCAWPKTRHRARCACLLVVRRSRCSAPPASPRWRQRARATPRAPRAEMGGGAGRRLRPRLLPARLRPTAPTPRRSRACSRPR